LTAGNGNGDGASPPSPLSVPERGGDGSDENDGNNESDGDGGRRTVREANR
jgi:hypothetical protein